MFKVVQNTEDPLKFPFPTVCSVFILDSIQFL